MSEPTAPPLLSARGLQLAFGSRVILAGVSFSLRAQEKAGLVGANGSGKSTLAQLLAGLRAPDSGELVRSRGLRVAYLPQQPQLDPALTPRQAVLEGLTEWQQARQRHREISQALTEQPAELERLLQAQAAAAAELERCGGWELEHRAEEMLGHLGLGDLEAPLGALSGGELRRVALARLFISAPELALLDEPTNHLDLHTVEWLEQYLATRFGGALLLITHDRYLLDRVAERTLELEHGQLYSVAGGYQEYLEAKAERLAQREQSEANRQRFLRAELQWLRRQPKARTTRQKARVKRAESSLEQEAPPAARQVRLQVEGLRSGKTILALQGLELAAGGQTLVRGLDFTMVRGQRVGIVGPNGCGKTTLLRAIIGELAPAAGQVQQGKNTTISYLSQLRDGLDLQKSVQENVAGRSPVVYLGETAVDVHSYLARFLFLGEALRQPVGALSGGERTRVALARLLAQPANLLLMDEPTNDLDVPTLSALEQLLLEFAGSALVVTHDRYFLDRVATDILAFEPGGQVRHYAGNFTLYQRLRPLPGEETGAADLAPSLKPAPPLKPAPAARDKKRRALTYAEVLELEARLAQIEQAEGASSALEQQLADPALYREGGNKVPALAQALADARAVVERLMARWEELESKRQQQER